MPGSVGRPPPVPLMFTRLQASLILLLVASLAVVLTVLALLVEAGT
jgi:hypothetical protein